MQPKVYDFEKKLDVIISKIRGYYPEFDDEQEERLKKAYWFAHEKHANQRRYSGDLYFTHPVESVEFLLSIKPDLETVSACLLHDVIEETSVTSEEIEEHFGVKIRFLCDGISKISKVQLNELETIENVRKLFVAMAGDIRVIFIKLADRIHNLSTLQYIPKHKQKRIARESLEIYAPVAAKLGLFEFKTQIEDLSFQHLYPDEFTQLSSEIIESRKEQLAFIERAKVEITELMDKECIEILEIYGRPKNLYSAFTKMQRKNFTSVSEIFDLFAIRIIVKDTSDCYSVLGALHSHWHPIPERFKDYVSISKANGYQSLHTTILGFGKIPVEVQIKTLEMHLDAEYGPAAHWAYKTARHSNFDPDYVKKIEWFPQNVSPDEYDSPEKYYEEVASSILKKQIYVFSPKGDIKNLPAKSTPVDFAFAVHTEIGEFCVGAKVNGVIRPLGYHLKEGDVVEILTQKGRKINPAWLDFVQSSKAVNKIRSYINKLNESTFVPKLSDNEKPKEKDEKVSDELTLKRLGDLSVSPVKADFDIIIGGERNIPYHLALCCNPKPGKSIVAYKTRGLEFSIHEIKCKELPNLDPERIIEAHFQTEKSYKVKAKDRVGLLHDMTKVFPEYGINLASSSIEFDKESGMTYWDFSIECIYNSECEELLKDLQKIPEVISLTKV